MKRLILLLILISIILSCEEIPNETIEPEKVNYTVLEISAPNILVYSATDNSISSSVLVENSENIKSIWFNINSIDGLEEISSNNKLLSNESTSLRTFSGKAILDKNLLSGKYEISYYIEDNIRASGENIFKVGSKQFQYISSLDNSAPIISNLNIPSSIDKQVEFVFSIAVSDSNGSFDISEVYFELNRPDGSIVYFDEEKKDKNFPMFDNGDFEGSGDSEADDGIYSLKNSFGPSSQTGGWLFTFAAQDKAGSVSNKITHTLIVN